MNRETLRRAGPDGKLQLVDRSDVFADSSIVPTVRSDTVHFFSTLSAEPDVPIFCKIPLKDYNECCIENCGENCECDVTFQLADSIAFEYANGLVTNALMDLPDFPPAFARMYAAFQINANRNMETKRKIEFSSEGIPHPAIISERITGVDFAIYVQDILKSPDFEMRFLSYMCQILLTLQFGQNAVNFNHGDLHCENILCKVDEDHPEGFVEVFTCEGRTYRMFNDRRHVMIDASRSHSHTRQKESESAGLYDPSNYDPDTVGMGDRDDLATRHNVVPSRFIEYGDTGRLLNYLDVWVFHIDKELGAHSRVQAFIDFYRTQFPTFIGKEDDRRHPSDVLISKPCAGGHYIYSRIHCTKTPHVHHEPSEWKRPIDVVNWIYDHFGCEIESVADSRDTDYHWKITDRDPLLPSPESFYTDPLKSFLSGFLTLPTVKDITKLITRETNRMPNIDTAIFLSVCKRRTEIEKLIKTGEPLKRSDLGIICKTEIDQICTKLSLKPSNRESLEAHYGV